MTRKKATAIKSRARVTLTAAQAIRIERAHARVGYLRQMFADPLAKLSAAEDVVAQELAEILKNAGQEETPLGWNLQLDGDDAHLVENVPEEGEG